MAKKKTRNEMKAEIFEVMSGREGSLAWAISEFINNKMPDRRRVWLPSSMSGIGLELVHSLAVDTGNADLPLEAFKDVHLIGDRRGDLVNSKIRLVCGEEFSESYDEYELPAIYYVAATFEGYTLGMVQDHLEEIESGIYDAYGERPEDTSRKYLNAMSKHNKNLPDDLKLWLSLR
jgi:hypothetical protein